MSGNCLAMKRLMYSCVILQTLLGRSLCVSWRFEGFEGFLWSPNSQ